MTGRSGGRGRTAGCGHDRGQATVELALCLPLVCVLLLLVVQVVLVARAQVLTVHAAREAARAAAVSAEPAGPTAAATQAGALDPSRLRVEVGPRGATGSMVTVTVRYDVGTDVPLVGPLLPDPVLEARATMRVE